MDVLVTSADVKPRPWKLFPRPEGLQILSLIDLFFDPFPNPFRVLVLSLMDNFYRTLIVSDRAQLSVTGHVSGNEAGCLVKSISVHAYIQRLHAVWPENECLYHIWSNHSLVLRLLPVFWHVEEPEYEASQITGATACHIRQFGGKPIDINTPP